MVPSERGYTGLNVAVEPDAVTWHITSLPKTLNVMVEFVIVAGSMVSLKVTLGFISIDTPVAPFAGNVELTVKADSPDTL
jgi:hypothetical protein